MHSDSGFWIRAKSVDCSTCWEAINVALTGDVGVQRSDETGELFCFRELAGSGWQAEERLRDAAILSAELEEGRTEKIERDEEHGREG